MIPNGKRLLIIATHPIQYQVPIFRELARMGFSVKVLFGSRIGVDSYYDKDFGQKFAWDVALLDGYDYEFLPGASRHDAEGVQPNKIRFEGLFKAMESFSPSAVVLFACATPFWIVALLAARALNVRVLLRAEIVNERHSLSARSIAKKMFYQAFFHLVDSLLVYGQIAFKNYQSITQNCEKFAWSPYSIDSCRFATESIDRQLLRASIRRKEGIPDSAFVILFAGKFISIKNPLIIFDALTALGANAIGEVTLLMMGDGELKKRLEEEAHRVPAKVVFVGFVNQSKIRDYHCAADILILPSIRETWGLVINESLQIGNPVICSDTVGAAADLVRPGSSGWLFEEGDTVGLRECIQAAMTVWSNGSLSSMRTKCTEVAEKFSVQHAASGIAEAVLTLRERII